MAYYVSLLHEKVIEAAHRPCVRSLAVWGIEGRGVILTTDKPTSRGYSQII